MGGEAGGSAKYQAFVSKVRFGGGWLGGDDPAAARSSADPSYFIQRRVEDCLSTAKGRSAKTGPANVFLFVFFALMVFVGPARADDVSKLQADFLQERYDSVLSGTRRLLKSPIEPRSDELLYLQGASALKTRNFDLAQSSFEKLAAKHPRSARLPEANLLLADTFYLSGQKERALELYRQISPEMTSGTVADHVRSRVEELEPKEEPLRSPRREFLPEKTPEDDFFSVQAGAFASEANALKVKTELERKGYPTSVTETDSMGKRFYRVRTGRFDKKEEAKALAERLKADGFPCKVVP